MMKGVALGTVLFSDLQLSSVSIIQLSSVSIIPPMLHTHSFINGIRHSWQMTAPLQMTYLKITTFEQVECYDVRGIHDDVFFNMLQPAKATIIVS